MASRTSSSKSSAALDPALSQKKRARRRLIGAAAVCLAAAILLPVLLDSEPRQVRGDVEARIPSRDTPLYERVDPTARSGSIRQSAPQPDAQPATQGAAPSAPAAPSAQGRETGAVPSTAQASQAAPQQAAPQAAPKTAVQAEVKPTAKPAAAAREPASAPKNVDDPIGKLAQAQEAQTPPEVPKGGGFIVQVGAFASEKGASEQIERTSKAGFKAYRETIKTAQGNRIRVRIGPYATRDEADRARATLRAAGIESVLIAP
jgi:DedD protein